MQQEVPKPLLEKIREAKEKQLVELDLSVDMVTTPYEERLTGIPAEVFELKQLEVLNLSGHRITDVTDEIGKLQNLKVLDLTANLLEKISDEVRRLENLVKLTLWSINITSNVKVPAWIGELRNLRSLFLLGFDMPEVPESISHLQNLTSLMIGSMELSVLPEWIVQLQNLTFLSFLDSNVAEVPPNYNQLHKLTHFGLSSYRLSEFPDVLLGLRNLEQLSLSSNQLTQIPDAVDQLQQLENLNLMMNNLTTLPDTISNLRNLKNLFLGNNNFTTIPESIYNLPSLKGLWLHNYSSYRNKNQLKAISPKILQLEKLENLGVDANSMETPPPEIVKQGVEAIKTYFRQIDTEGVDHLYEAKLLVVGEGGAGKTTLAKKIQDPNYQLQEDETSTKGIEVMAWRFPLENGKQFRVNIWDFGGQVIYHTTHQFFLTKRSLYVLVADSRKEDTDFNYWLNAVEQLSEGSPVLIIKNEKQGRQPDINERQLRGRFTNLQEVLSTDLANNSGLDKILNEIKHHVTQLPHIGSPLPRTWVRVRERLERDARNHITLGEYLNICEQHGFKKREDKLLLSSYLHDIGVCLHFQDDPLLNKTVILKPRWGTDAVYKVLDNQTVKDKLGKFDQADLRSIWNEEEYADMQAELLQLMINFKLCYRIPDEDSYIAPQLLTENQPEYTWDETDNLILRYTYQEFMPKGIVTQFIVVMNTLIARQRDVWKSGVILEKDRTRAEVIEYYGRREIRIRVAGKRKKELLTIATYELDKIHGSYKQLKYKKLIPCNCIKCKESREPNFYPYETLRKYMDDRRETIECTESYERVDVRKLIDDVMIESDKSPDEIGKAEALLLPPTRDQVFISYSHDDDEKWLDKLQKMLKPAIRNKRISLWDDTQIKVGTKWRDEIKRALASARAAVLLVSPNFLASDFIAKHELPHLLEASKNEGLTIFCVAVSHSLYEETAIVDYQWANEPSEPLDSLPDSEVNKVLSDIARKIRDEVNPPGAS